MDHNTVELQDFHQRFDSLRILVDTLLEHTRNGEIPPLGSLNRDVDLLCKEVKNAAPDICREMQPAMANIIAKLDELARELSLYKQKLSIDKKD